MDASLFVFTFSLVFVIGHSSGIPQVETTSEVLTSTVSTEVPPKTCVTGKDVPGHCIDRQYCDYSTYTIDLTLYEPKGYIRTCIDNEVCCPANYQLAAEMKESFDDNFEFDEND